MQLTVRRRMEIWTRLDAGGLVGASANSCGMADCDPLMERLAQFRHRAVSGRDELRIRPLAPGEAPRESTRRRRPALGSCLEVQFASTGDLGSVRVRPLQSSKEIRIDRLTSVSVSASSDFTFCTAARAAAQSTCAGPRSGRQNGSADTLWFIDRTISATAAAARSSPESTGPFESE